MIFIGVLQTVTRISHLKKSSEGRYIRVKEKISIEKDMLPREYVKEDKLSTRIFKKCSLVGDYIPEESDLDAWFDRTRKFIRERLNDKLLTYQDWVYEYVALTVVHYAKSWNSNEEGRFTKYVTMKLGYKDDTGRIWNILTEAIENAFVRNKRLFIRRNGNREFYETIMVHSFGPNGAWYPLVDLLFLFYMENLDWAYYPGDPLFSNLVYVLQGYFNNTEVENDQYDIASNKYRLRIGIRRLVQERPGYCASLFEVIVKRIHQLLKNEASESNRYAFKLVDQWFSDKISHSSAISKKNHYALRKPAEVALNYSDIILR